MFELCIAPRLFIFYIDGMLNNLFCILDYRSINKYSRRIKNLYSRHAQATSIVTNLHALHAYNISYNLHLFK